MKFGHPISAEIVTLMEVNSKAVVAYNLVKKAYIPL